MQHLYDLQDIAGHKIHPTHPVPREAEDFPMGDKYPKKVPLSKYFNHLQGVKSIILHWYLDMLKLWMLLFVVKSLVKKAQ